MADPFPGPAHADPAHLVVAYCAPGLKNYATRLLETNGDRVDEVLEHPSMVGRADVLQATSRLERERACARADGM